MPRPPGPSRAQTPPETESQLLQAALGSVQELLPRGWSQALRVEPPDRGAYRPDAMIDLQPPTGEPITFVVEVKRTISPRELPYVLMQLRSYIAAEPGRGMLPMVVARYLPPSTRRHLIEEHVAFADATGNIRIAADRPALFLRDRGTDSDPWRGPGRPRGTLIGEPPARVVRALVDYEPPFSVPRLIELSGASTGATYRVVEFLEQEALITRTPRGPIDAVRWPELLRRWSQDYGFTRSNRVRSFLSPRGVTALTTGLAMLSDVRYAVTGSIAAAQWAPYAPAAAAMIYTDDTDRLAELLNLRPVDSGANVMIATAAYDAVFDRAENTDGITVVAPSQAVVDLLTGPGRSPAEAQALLEWMEQHVQQWRRQ